MPRNAPCPCGSGRKFKRCCAGTLDDPAAISRKHDQVGTRIQAWAFEHYDAEAQAAVEEIMAGREDAVLGAVDLQLVASWVFNDRELPGGGTAAQRYAVRQDLQPDERDMAARIAAARLGLLRVLRVMPGRWIELYDLTGGDDLVRVISHDVSRSAHPDAVLVGRLMDGPPARRCGAQSASWIVKPPASWPLCSRPTRTRSVRARNPLALLARCTPPRARSRSCSRPRCDTPARGGKPHRRLDSSWNGRERPSGLALRLGLLVGASD